MGKSPLKYKLTEEDIEKMVRGILFHLKESFDNPFTNNHNLTEGIFSTYKPEKVEKYLKKRYGEYAFVERYTNENKVEIFRIGFYNDEDGEKIVNKDMSLCGYFPSYIWITEDGTIKYITYEPQHQKSVKGLIENRRYIYHLTPENKIQKIGLVPKTNNKKFKYPSRIYFFLNKPTKYTCIDLITQFSDATENEYWGKYNLLEIDTRKVGDADFFFDPNAKQCVYTYDNIPPESLKIIDTI